MSSKKSTTKPTVLRFIIITIITAMVGTMCLALVGCQATPASASRITIGLKLAPTNLDIRQTSGAALDQVLLDNVYEGLLTLDQENQPKASLACSWAVSLTKPYIYTFTLCDGTKFADGSDLTAKDAENSINELISKKYKGSEQLSKVTAVKAEDERKLSITLSEPDSNLLWNLAGRAGVVVNNKDDLDLKNAAAGSGPYVIADQGWDEGNSLLLTKNKNYWGGKDHNEAKTDEILFRYITDETASINALQADEIQILAPILEKNADKLSDNENYDFLVGEGTDKYTLAFNNSKAPLDNPKVREAIRLAIDHNELIQAHGPKSDKKLGGPIPQLDPGYEEIPVEYNPEKAKSLLNEALSSGGRNVENRLKLTLKYPAAVYGSEIGSLLASQLKKIGIDLEVINTEFTTWLNDVYTNKDYDLSMVDHNESHDFENWTNPDYYFNYNNKEVQNLYKQAISQVIDSERDKLLAKAAKIVSDENAADWLFNYNTTTAIKKGLVGFSNNFNQARLPVFDLAITS